LKKVETNSIGYRIRQARERARTSQEELAKMLDVSKRTLIGWEKNERNPKDAMLQLIADATTTGIESLLAQSVNAINTTEERKEDMYRAKYEQAQQEIINLLKENAKLKDKLLGKPQPSKEKKAN
jgi:transcriptional regulator with XRE-family HTH domain